MTIATPNALPALPTELPAVEQRAIIPAGFRAGGAAAGIKASGRPDVAIIATLPDEDGRPVLASVAAVFTPSAFLAAPVRLSKAHLAAGVGRFGVTAAIVSTSGCANAATGVAGDADQLAVAEMLAAALGIEVERTLHLSTGIIGTRLP
ncbi:MAG TPA: bifunctional ornithine acetyltransferase/N-acetylglutamate synthase, partial [Candidatus Limnocylindrales bacterium]|nr:bifunctional ornithine acetyltransferase/N-acetylglutamate synthase [Candidatus Limnocylindrales bacterium]